MSAGTPISVLFIDDDEAVRSEVQSLLMLRNIECKTAFDIAAARTALSNDRRLRLIVVDFHLPGMTGVEVIELLRAEFDRELGFIVLTGDESQVSAIEAVRAGADDFLRKPPDGRELVRTINRVWQSLSTDIGPVRDAVVSAKSFEVVSGYEMCESLRDLASQIRERERGLERLSHDSRLPQAADRQGWRTALNVLLNHLRAVRTKVEHDLDPADPRSVEALAAQAERLIDTLSSTVVADDSRAETNGSQKIDLCNLVDRLSPSIEQSVSQRQVRLQVQLPEQPIFITDSDGKLERAIAEITRTAMSPLKPGDQLVLSIRPSKAEGSLVLRIDCGISDMEAIKSIFDGTTKPEADNALYEQQFKAAAYQLMIGLRGGHVSTEKSDSGELFIKINLPVKATMPRSRDAQPSLRRGTGTR